MIEKLPAAETVGAVGLLIGAVIALWRRLEALTDRYVKGEGDRFIELQGATADRLRSIDMKADAIAKDVAEIKARGK